MTTEQIRPRLTVEETEELRKVAERCGMNATTLAGIFVRSVLKAVKEYGEERRIIPLHVEITEEHHKLLLNEQPPSYRTKNKKP